MQQEFRDAVCGFVNGGLSGEMLRRNYQDGLAAQQPELGSTVDDDDQFYLARRIRHQPVHRGNAGGYGFHISLNSAGLFGGNCKKEADISLRALEKLCSRVILSRQ